MMEILRTLGYYAAAVLAVTLPPGFLYWFLVHPFVAFWRRLGKTATFVIVGLVCVTVAFALWQLEDRFMAWHWGYHWPLILIGLGLYGLGIVVERRIRHHLTFRVLAGVPEIDESTGSRLLTEGPFARCRNPRYVNLLVSTLGIALILNYPILYLELILAVPTIYLLVLFEERELVERFGAEYEAYRRRVPRFIPRRGWLV